MKIVNNEITRNHVWYFGGLLFLSVILRALSRRIVDGLQSGTGYEIFARERMKIGDHLKRLPMGYFSEGTVGNVTAVVTSDIVFVEQYSMSTLSKVINGYINMVLGTIMMMVFDFLIGLIVLATFIFASRSLVSMNKVVANNSEVRQKGQSKLIGSVLEYVKGISVIKSFNMVGEKAKKLDNQFREYRDISINFEKKFVPAYKGFNNWFTLGIATIVLAASYFGFNGTLDVTFMMMIIIYIFQFFIPFQVLGTVAAQVRIMEACLDRYDAVMNAEIIDEDGKDISLDKFNIEFKM